jgi:N-acetylneuraminic acid mutarotase
MNRVLPIALPVLLLASCQGQAGAPKVAATPPKTVISSARVQGGTLILSGTYFAPESTVTLAGATVKPTTLKPQEIIVPVPDSLGPGTYLVNVTAGTPATTDSFVATVGAAGPPGPSGPPGSSATFPPGTLILGDSPTPPKGFSHTGYSVVSQGGSIGWTLKAPMPTARFGVCAAVVKGVLYAIGGAKDDGLQGLPTVEAYDIATDSWTTKAPMPTGRSGAGIGVLNGLIYVVGGAPAKDATTGAFEVYDPAANKWTAKAAIPTPKKGVATAVVKDVLYVIGDFASFSSPSGAGAPVVEAYDPATDAWTPKAALPTARTNFSVGVVNNMLFAIGGSEDTAVAVTEAYDPATNAWVAKAPMPTPRKGFAVGVINGVLYAAGGRSDADLAGIAVSYDPMHDTWSAGLAVPIPVDGTGGCASDDGVLYLVGGTAQGGKAVAGLQAFTPSGPRYYIHRLQ